MGLVMISLGIFAAACFVGVATSFHHNNLKVIEHPLLKAETQVREAQEKDQPVAMAGTQLARPA